MNNEMMRNFTAILPVTCNADCSFCPEKEMEKKAPTRSWLKSLIKQINDHEGEFDHVSLSGGEATLKPKFLFEVIDQIQANTDIDKIGLTSNDRFLNKPEDIFKFLDLNTNGQLESKLSHLNISRHSFDNDLNNEIMKVNYTYTLEDLARFRRQLGRKLSFHINFVINEKNIDNLEWEMQQAKAFMKEHAYIDVVFRVDYNLADISRELREYGQSVQRHHETKFLRNAGYKRKVTKIRAKPELVALFDSVFDGTSVEEGAGDTWTDACPSCFTHRGTRINKSHAWLKASSYEPNDDEDEYTEFVFHMDGKLYYDWSRNEPVPRVKNVKRKPVAEPVDDIDEDEEDDSILVRRDVRDSHNGRCGYPMTRCGY